eukprot:443189_1
MNPNFEQLKCINQRTQYSVFGFVRISQKSFWNVPVAIINIILFYFYDDEWDKNCKSDDIRIVGSSVINTSWYTSSAYLRRSVSEGIHVWSFKIDELYNDRVWQLIGCWKTKFDPVIDRLFTTDGGNKCYAFSLNYGYLMDPSKKYGQRLKNYGIQCKYGDIIKMTLNFNDLTLSFKMNNIEYGTAFDVERTSYKVAATLSRGRTKFTLLSYKYRAQ